MASPFVFSKSTIKKHVDGSVFDLPPCSASSKAPRQRIRLVTVKTENLSPAERKEFPSSKPKADLADTIERSKTHSKKESRPDLVMTKALNKKDSREHVPRVPQHPNVPLRSVSIKSVNDGATIKPQITSSVNSASKEKQQRAPKMPRRIETPPTSDDDTSTFACTKSCFFRSHVLSTATFCDDEASETTLEDDFDSILSYVTDISSYGSDFTVAHGTPVTDHLQRQHSDPNILATDLKVSVDEATNKKQPGKWNRSTRMSTRRFTSRTAGKDQRSDEKSGAHTKTDITRSVEIKSKKSLILTKYAEAGDDPTECVTEDQIDADDQLKNRSPGKELQKLAKMTQRDHGVFVADQSCVEPGKRPIEKARHCRGAYFNCVMPFSFVTQMK